MILSPTLPVPEPLSLSLTLPLNVYGAGIRCLALCRPWGHEVSKAEGGPCPCEFIDGGMETLLIYSSFTNSFSARQRH